ncbi:uncharacterized protein LOC110019131 isoform X3 [Phalaenopsis equestris]|uniref:uncharacterized protein LOC110019131 isoform X3 n=1 Tax=Phalaenopsis equestris TaxID=78828 RepID=UPI0009E58ADF|nr:uncharacterized protein LOC110019131 isoform X3 [Phalaenopsis equestris]
MALLSPSHRLSVSISSSTANGVLTANPNLTSDRIVFVSKGSSSSQQPYLRRTLRRRLAASNLREQASIGVDLSLSSLNECFLDEELHAAVRLRIRTFYDFNQSCGAEDYKKYLTEREYEALKERVAGKKIGFKRVSCINATLPSSTSLRSFAELCSSCKGIGPDLKRGYLSNICVAKELQRNGLGHALIAKSKNVARHWGITDLYVHVAVDNEAAQKLYERSGFIYENEEPAWQARFLGRPRRFLLWADLRLAN